MAKDLIKTNILLFLCFFLVTCGLDLDSVDGFYSYVIDDNCRFCSFLFQVNCFECGRRTSAIMLLFEFRFVVESCAFVWPGG